MRVFLLDDSLPSVLRCGTDENTSDLPKEGPFGPQLARCVQELTQLATHVSKTSSAFFLALFFFIVFKYFLYEKAI